MSPQFSRILVPTFPMDNLVISPCNRHEFQIRENQNLEARAEAHNLTNSLRRGNPITNFSSGIFGRPHFRVEEATIGS